MTRIGVEKNIPFMTCPALGELSAILLEAKALPPPQTLAPKMMINYE